MGAAASAGLAAVPAAAAQQNAIFELRYYHMRNGSQTQRTADFLGKHFLPAAQRLGIGPLGFFSAVDRRRQPLYPGADQLSFRRGFRRRHGTPGRRPGVPGGLRRVQLHDRAELHPHGELAAAGLRLHAVHRRRARRHSPVPHFRAAHLRIQQRQGRPAQDPHVQRREAAIFERLGMAPVFFGETLVGRNLPNLTYMLSFESMAARDNCGARSAPTPHGRSCARSRVTRRRDRLQHQ
jgi:hypothetical protein